MWEEFEESIYQQFSDLLTTCLQVLASSKLLNHVRTAVYNGKSLNHYSRFRTPLYISHPTSQPAVNISMHLLNRIPNALKIMFPILLMHITSLQYFR